MLDKQIKLSDFTDMYIDLDTTLRETFLSNIMSKLVTALNIINSRVRLHILTDNRFNSSEIESYLRSNNVSYYELITPLKSYNIVLSDRDKMNGYKVADGYVYIFKFPIISVELMQTINSLKKIRVIGLDNWEDSYESLGILPKINIPFVGKFISMLDKDISIERIGKISLIVNSCCSKKGIMIGDSNADQIFASNNMFKFKHVNSPADTLSFLTSLI